MARKATFKLLSWIAIILLLPFLGLMFLITSIFTKAEKEKTSNIMKGPGIFFISINEDRILLTTQPNQTMEDNGYTWLKNDLPGPFYVKAKNYNDVRIYFVGTVKND